MKKIAMKIFAAVMLLCVILPLLPARTEAVGLDRYYTYNYDWYNYALPSPDAYTVRYRIDPAELGVGKLKAAVGMFVRGDELYLVDTGNNRILQLRLSEMETTLVREITGTEEWTLSAPEDVFVTEDGTIYIADTGNRRVLVVDKELNILSVIEQPTGATYDATVEFKPSKLAVTAGDRLYVQATGVNKGLLEFSPEGVFNAYIGASSVRFDWQDYIWKLISTDAQVAQMESFVPTEYNNIALDHKGYLFVTTNVFEVSDLLSGAAEPVRRLNQKGKNILIQNDWLVIGDYQWGKTGPSRFVDVTVLDNGLYYVLDSTNNRIFAYDTQGTPLYAFGGYGTRSGYFQSPKALEHWGTDLLVLDSTSGLVTVMRQTEYGALVQEAIDTYAVGEYDASYDCWEQVLQHNGNYRLAYDGIGKILLRNGEYMEALEYLEYARDRYYHSKAFALYRKDLIEKYLIYVVAAILILVVVLAAVKIIRKEREALQDYEDRYRRIRDQESGK